MSCTCAVDLVRSARCAGKNWTEPNQRRNAGSKHHIVTDARGVPLVAHVTAAKVNDITHLDTLVADLPAVRCELHDRVHHAFLTLGCALITWRYLKREF